MRGNRGDGRCQRLQTGHAVLPLCEQHRVAWPEQMEAVARLSAHPKVVAAEPAPRAAGSRPAKQSRAGPGAGCCPHAPRLSSRSQQGLGLSPAKLFAGGAWALPMGSEVAQLGRPRQTSPRALYTAGRCAERSLLGAGCRARGVPRQQQRQE